MTVRNLYEGVLIELHKENAPNILLEDFNYFANKAINNYTNKRYNIYDINQQTTDDLRVLKATAMLDPVHTDDYKGMTMAGDNHMATYEVIMPSDYLHILNCICIYKVNKTYKCYNAGDTWRAAATRLTADAYSQVLDNFWNKPTYKRPYYYIHNVNTSVTVPTNPVKYKGEEDDGDGNMIQYQKRLYSCPFDILPSGSTKPSTQYLVFALREDNKFYLLVNGDDHPIYLDRTNSPYTFEDIQNGEILNLPKTITKDQTVAVNSFYNTDTINVMGKVYSTEDVVICTNPKRLLNFAKVKYVGTDVPSLTTENPNGTAGFDPGDTDYQYPNPDFGTDSNDNTIVQGEGFPRYIISNGQAISNVERGQAIRYGNVSQVRLEIRYGTDNSVFQLHKVYVDYIKAPQNIRLTQREIDLTEDTSQMLEYPDYVYQEIINELVHLVMENISDQRLQTHPVVSQSIANPTQAQAPEAAGQSA